MNSHIKRNIIANYSSDLILGTYFQLPIWIVYQSKFLNFGQIAFFSGLSLITEVIAQLPTGAFADLVGRRYALSLGNLFMALAMFLIALYPKPEIMIMYSILWGLGRAFCMGTSKPVLYETLEMYNKTSIYPKILSRSVILFQVSAAISIVSGGYLYLIRPNLPYIVSGLASLIGVFTAFIFVETKVTHTSGRLLQFVHTAKSGFFEIFKNSYISKLTILYVLTLGIAHTSQQFFMQPFMLELGLNDIARSWTAMIIKITIALLGAKILATTKIFNNKYFLLIIPTLLVFSLLPAGFVKMPWAYLVFIGIAFNSGNTDLFLSSEINAHLNSNVRSTAISIQRMLASTFGAIIQWLSIVPIAMSGVGTYYSYLGIFSLLVILPLGYRLALHRHRHNQASLPALELEHIQK
jgi:MFS family permease